MANWVEITVQWFINDPHFLVIRDGQRFQDYHCFSGWQYCDGNSKVLRSLHPWHGKHQRTMKADLGWFGSSMLANCKPHCHEGGDKCL